MNIQRIARHLLMTDRQVSRTFGRSTLNKIEAAIKASEAEHVGEIRFAVEGGLDGTPLFKGQSARERAIEIFSQLRVWDTQHNTGVLIYLLLAQVCQQVARDALDVHGYHLPDAPPPPKPPPPPPKPPPPWPPPPRPPPP